MVKLCGASGSVPGAIHTEQAKRQMRELLALPAGLCGRLANDVDATLIKRAQPAPDELARRTAFLEQRTLQEACEMRMLGKVIE